MTVQAYLFQSPYFQPFQVGRPDPASMKEAEQERTETNQQTRQENNKAVQLENVGMKTSIEVGPTAAFLQIKQQVMQQAQSA